MKLLSNIHPDDAPYYYLGNLLYDKQPEKAIEYWENAVKFDPSLAIAGPESGMGILSSSGDRTESNRSYEKAMSLKKMNRYIMKSLMPLYEMSNAPS